MARVDAEYQDYLDAHGARPRSTRRASCCRPRQREFVVSQARSTPAGLLEIAEEHEASLIVLGSSSAGVLGRVAFGSVTDRLLHSSPLPVALAPRGFRCRPDSPVRAGDRRLRRLEAPTSWWSPPRRSPRGWARRCGSRRSRCVRGRR